MSHVSSSYAPVCFQTKPVITCDYYDYQFYLHQIICDYVINVQNGVHQAVRVLTWGSLNRGMEAMEANFLVSFHFVSHPKRCGKLRGLGPSLLIQSQKLPFVVLLPLQSLHPKKCRSMHGPMAGREHKRFRLCLFDLHWLWWSFLRTSWSVLGTLTAGVTRAADALVLAVSHKKTMQDSAVATIDWHHGKNSSLGCHRSMLKWFCSCRQ